MDLNTFLYSSLPNLMSNYIEQIFSGANGTMLFTWSPSNNSYVSKQRFTDLGEGKDPNTSYIQKGGYCIGMNSAQGQTIGLFNAYKQQTKQNTFDALNSLALICNFDLQGELGADYQNYNKAYDMQKQLERLAQLTQEALFQDKGKEVLDYLHNTRKYTDGFIKYAKLGYVDNAITKECNIVIAKKEVDDRPLIINCYCDNRYYKPILRKIKEDKDGNKYHYFADDKKTERLFGITAPKTYDNKDKRLVLVEGQLDMLRLQYAFDKIGLKVNVAGLGGSTISDAQITQILSNEYKKVYLLLDTDTKDKDQNTLKAIEKISKQLQDKGLEVYIARIPRQQDDIKIDVDSFLRDYDECDNRGYRELQKIVLTDSKFIYSFKLSLLYEEYQKEVCKTSNHDNALYSFIRQSAVLIARNTHPLYKEILRQEFKSMLPYGHEATANNLEQWLYNEEQREQEQYKENQQKQLLHDQLNRATQLVSDGDLKATIELIKKITKEQTIIKNENKYKDDLRILTKEEFVQVHQDEGTDYNLPYILSDDKDSKESRRNATIPRGGITTIGAQSSHGKTTFLVNLALQLATNQEEGAVLFYSYEEGKADVLDKFINVYCDTDLKRGNNLEVIKGYFATGNLINKSFISNQKEQDKAFEQFSERQDKFFSELLETGKLFVYDKTYLTEELIEAVQYATSQIKVKAIFVDYVQLMNIKDNPGTKKDILESICLSLMELAKEKQIPIVMGAQVKRDQISPFSLTLNAIESASNIGQQSNTVYLLYNSSFDLRTFKDQHKKEDEEAKKINDKYGKYSMDNFKFKFGKGGYLFLLQDKCRNGQRGLWTCLDYNGNTGKISALKQDIEKWEKEQNTSNTSTTTEEPIFEIEDDTTLIFTKDDNPF